MDDNFKAAIEQPPAYEDFCRYLATWWIIGGDICKGFLHGAFCITTCTHQMEELLFLKQILEIKEEK